MMSTLPIAPSKISGAAIQVTSDAKPLVEGDARFPQITIRDNTINRVNFANAARLGAIDIFADIGRDPAPSPVHKQIRIDHNHFAGIIGLMIHVRSAEQADDPRQHLFRPHSARRNNRP